MIPRARRWLGARIRQRSLRRRLVAGVLVLVTTGLLVADVAAVFLLRSYLLDQADEQLRTAQALAERVEGQVGWPPPDASLLQGRPGLLEQRALDDFVIEYRDAEGERTLRMNGALRSGDPPELPRLTLADARELAGRPFDVENESKGPIPTYRALVWVPPGGDGTVTIAYDMTDSVATVRRLIGIEAVVTTVVVATVALLSVAVVRVGLRPLDDVEQTAEAIISGGDLGRRVPGGRGAYTEIGRLSATLNRMLGQIQQAFHQRAASEARLRRFVADASHELRTPLAGIRGLAELHRQGAVRDPDEVARLIGRIEAEATRMGVLVEDLLLLARLDQERPLQREPVDLLPVAVDAVESARVRDPDRPVELAILTETDDESGPVVIGDEQRLHQVAANLVSNALAHTPSGTPVTVRVGTVRPGDGGDAGLLEVADHGPGLTPEQAERAFERFFRADPARRREHDRRSGGTGLGLSIVAAIVAAHGGQVEHTPTPGGGATFRVLLPLAG